MGSQRFRNLLQIDLLPASICDTREGEWGGGAAQAAKRGSELDQVGAWESRRPCACTVHVGVELRPQEVNFLCDQ